MAGNTVGRHRREGFPFVESRRDGSHRYRRNVPDDLRNIIGDAWETRFPASTPLEKVSERSTLLPQPQPDQEAVDHLEGWGTRRDLGQGPADGQLSSPVTSDGLTGSSPVPQPYLGRGEE